MNKIQLQQQLIDAFENFTSPLHALSNETLNAKPEQGTWTLGQLVQHIVLATSGLPDKETKTASRPSDQLEPSIRETFLESQEKFTSPEFITPAKKEYDCASLITNLHKNENDLLAIIKEKDLNQLCMDIELPGWGNLTRLEWIKLITYHIQRHTKQLKNLLNNQAS
ncbi:MAG TPA: DinB family protein [Bacteroidia bacterium]|nr:DinB family protein [Bacteroidia bacterium]